jgi:rhodanese-related sulfurtransferase
LFSSLQQYANVQSKLDTGPTISKMKLISNSAFSKRRDEIFFRLSKGQLLQLYSEYEADEYEDIAETDRSYDGPRIVTYDETSRPVYDKPYLIIDVRDDSEYHQYHLLQARNYSYTMMRRDQVHPEMMKFRNKEGYLIIVVADDERLGADAAKLLVDRGTDNIFLLSASILEFAEENPGYIEGNPPISKASPRLSTGTVRYFYFYASK